MCLRLLYEIMQSSRYPVPASYSGWIQCPNCTEKFEVKTLYMDITVEYCPLCGDTIDDVDSQ